MRFGRPHGLPTAPGRARTAGRSPRRPTRQIPPAPFTSARPPSFLADVGRRTARTTGTARLPGGVAGASFAASRRIHGGRPSRIATSDARQRGDETMTPTPIVRRLGLTALLL